MEQQHDILKNLAFSGAANININSALQYENEYYFNITGEASKIVDSSDVRAFLSNENNQKVVASYYSFLTGSPLLNSALLVNISTDIFTPTAQFKAIFYDDEKLADSFNNYYNSSILRGLNSNYSENPDIFNTSIRNQLLSSDTYQYVTQNVFHNYYFWSSSTPNTPAYSPPKYPFFTAGTPYFTNVVLDIYDGDRDIISEERLVEIPVEGEYYFINVFLTQRFTQTARMSFESCSNSIYKILNSNTIFSQNPSDILNYQDYFSPLETPDETSFDSTAIKSPNFNTYYSATTSQEYSIKNLRSLTGSFSAITGVTKITASTSNDVQLIQCFVDPNFLVNQNEYWSDGYINTVNFEFNNYYVPLKQLIGVKVYLEYPAKNSMTIDVKMVNWTAINSEYTIGYPYAKLKNNKIVNVDFNQGEIQKYIYFYNGIIDENVDLSELNVIPEQRSLLLSGTAKQVQIVLSNPIGYLQIGATNTADILLESAT